jgi:hypothetical protein
VCLLPFVGVRAPKLKGIMPVKGSGAGINLTAANVADASKRREKPWAPVSRLLKARRVLRRYTLQPNKAIKGQKNMRIISRIRGKKLACLFASTAMLITASVGTARVMHAVEMDCTLGCQDSSDCGSACFCNKPQQSCFTNE